MQACGFAAFLCVWEFLWLNGLLFIQLLQISFVVFLGYAHLVPSVGRLQNVFEFSFCLFVH